MKRITLATLSVFGLILLLASALVQPAVATPTRNAAFRGDLQHTGVYLTGPVQGAPELLWKFQTGARVVSSPAVTQDIVYFGSYDGYVYSVEKTSGSLVWKFKTGDQVKSSPAVLNNTVFFASKDGYFYALKASDGSLRWKFKTEDEKTDYYERGIPWFTDGIDPWFYDTLGEIRFSRINDPWDCYYSSPAISEGTVYIGAYDGSVYALNSDTGELTWRFRTGGPVRSSPAIAGQTLYVGSFDGHLYALDLATGVEKWRSASIPGEWNTAHFVSSPSVAGGMVFIGGRDSYLHAVDAVTGETKWILPHDNGSWAISSPAILNGTVYEGSSDGLYIHAVNAQTGLEEWRFPTLHNVFASPAIAGDTLYVGDFNGYQLADASFMYALDLQTGAEKWRFPTQGSASSPVIDDGVLYFGTEDGYLYALK